LLDGKIPLPRNGLLTVELDVRTIGAEKADAVFVIGLLDVDVDHKLFKILFVSNEAVLDGCCEGSDKEGHMLALTLGVGRASVALVNHGSLISKDLFVTLVATEFDQGLFALGIIAGAKGALVVEVDQGSSRFKFSCALGEGILFSFAQKTSGSDVICLLTLLPLLACVSVGDDHGSLLLFEPVFSEDCGDANDLLFGGGFN
jgi:hypothetical protein